MSTLKPIVWWPSSPWPKYVSIDYSFSLAGCWPGLVWKLSCFSAMNLGSVAGGWWCDVRNNPFSGSCDVSIIHMLWVAASAWLSGTWRGGVETQRGTLINLRANAIRCLLPQWRSAAATYYSILTFFQSSGSSSRIGIHGVGSSSTRRTGNSLDWKK